MRLIVSFLAAILLAFSTIAITHAATTTVTTVTNTTIIKPVSHYKKQVSHYKKHKHSKHYSHCKCKHYKHVKKSYPVRSYYSPGYCVADRCACGCKVCYPGHYYQCRTEYYYHSGRNSARVEVCY